MSLSNFSHTEVAGQRGQRRITFACQDHNAVPHRWGPYHTNDVGFDPVAFYPTVEAKIDEGLKAGEIEDWLNDTEAIAVPNHAARPRYLSTWRARYKNGTKEEHRRLGYKMHREILAGTFTNPQMNNAWGMTNPERTAFLGRVEIAHDKWVTLQAEVGE